MNGPDSRMTIVDLRIPFFRLVFFFVKAALALIPAAIILTLIFSLLGIAIAAIFSGFFPEFQRFFEMLARKSMI